MRLQVVQLRHTDAQWRDDLSDLPAACRQETPPLASPTAVAEHIAEISTRFWLASACALGAGIPRPHGLEGLIVLPGRQLETPGVVLRPGTGRPGRTGCAVLLL
jgi:hypothetical protein